MACCLVAAVVCEVSLLAPEGCEQLLCENGAPCVESASTAACQCLPGFGGPHCEKLLSVNFIDRDSYLLLNNVKNRPQTNITLQVQERNQLIAVCVKVKVLCKWHKINK